MQIEHKQLLARLYPPVSYNINGERFLTQCEVDGNAFDRVQKSAVDVLGVVTPITSGLMINDWERVCGLENASSLPYSVRVQNVVKQLNVIGGLSIPYFVNIASTLGYEISIDELTPFRAGENRAGDELLIEDSIFCWQVNIRANTQNVVWFYAGVSLAGERLSEYHDNVIETFFNEIKPAHTAVRFTYGEHHATN